MEKYKILEKIGESPNAEAYKVMHKETGQLLVILKKELDITYEDDIPQATMQEVSSRKVLSESRYVICLLNVVYMEENDMSFLLLFFECLPTHLTNFINYHVEATLGDLPPPLVQRFLFQLLKALHHCHSRNVFHWNLKPQNLWVDTTSEVLKIADLGIATSTVPPRMRNHAISSLHYTAPEVLLGSPYVSTSVDIWSVGCIFAEMMKMLPLFSGGDCEVAQLLTIFRVMGTPTENEWPGVTTLPKWDVNPPWEPMGLLRLFPSLGPDGVDLLSKMLKYNPEDRISAREALDHPYFDSLDKSEL